MSKKKAGKVVAAYVHYNGVPEKFLRCMWDSKGVDFSDFVSASSARINAARTANGVNFLESDADWIFYVDTDMVWEVGAVAKMKKWATMRGVKAVAGWTIMNKNGLWPNAFRLEQGTDYVPWGHIRPFSEPIQVDAVGGSCFLVHREVIEKVKENYTGKTGYFWQEEPYVPHLAAHRGEDIEFSRKIVEAGYDIWYHPDAIFMHTLRDQMAGPKQYSQFYGELQRRIKGGEYDSLEVVDE